MRRVFTTTIRADLVQQLQFEAIRRGVNANDILEELLAQYFKKSKGGDQR